MTSFVFDIGETPRKVARAIGHVRSELQKAFAAEKKARKLTQQAIATKRGVNRSVINRQLTGVEDLTYRSIVENALAMGYEPQFSLRKSEIIQGQNELQTSELSDPKGASPVGTGTNNPFVLIPSRQPLPTTATITQAKQETGG
ncbi:MAG TPA: XRE family transcriptional regulator [Roseiarcus sp.]